MKTTAQSTPIAKTKKKPSAPSALVQPILPTVAPPHYWEEAKQELMKKDRILKKIILQHDTTWLKSDGDPFVTLIRSIIGQQISVKAAQSIWEKLKTQVPITPARISRCSPVQLQKCGISFRKAGYLLDLAAHFGAKGTLRSIDWTTEEDESIITELTKVSGIGRWTAEMFLLFCLCRPNVFPIDDLGLQKAVSQNYCAGEPITRNMLRDIGEAWSPWRSVGTWYMWRSISPIPSRA